jgi:epoxyqueuosine reductase
MAMGDMGLTGALRQYLLAVSHDAALVGIASADRFEGAPRGHHPCDFLAEARSVVVVALPIVSGLMGWHEYMADSEVIRDLETCVDKDGAEHTWSPRTAIRKHIERRCCYEVINDELQALSMYGAIFLEKAGYSSTYLPTTYGMTLSWPGNYQWDFPKPPRGFAPFSHKHAAVAAGLGQFGLSNLLLTPQHGPRQRLVSIITAAPLAADPLLADRLCLGEDCARCITNCPAGAFGESHEVEVAGQRAALARFDVEACRGYYKDSVFGAQCARECLTHCPAGRRESA